VGYSGLAGSLFYHPIQAKHSKIQQVASQFMHPENTEFLQYFLTQAFPHQEWPDLTPEKINEYTLQLRIWAIQEQEAFETGVAKAIESFTSPESGQLVIGLIEKYSPLQIAWITREATRRSSVD
jgi:hypothetical protein